MGIFPVIDMDATLCVIKIFIYAVLHYCNVQCVTQKRVITYFENINKNRAL